MYPVPTTALTQGRTDRFIGSWLKRQPRDSVLLATKVAGRSERITWLREGGAGCRVDAANITASVEASLRRLGTDYVDLLQVHWPDRYVSLWGGKPYDAAEHTPDATPVSEQLAALASLVAAGKVRAIGVSNETTFGVTEWARAAREGFGPKICSIQNAYHLLCRVPFETDLAEACAPHNLNVGLLAYSPLAGGALTNKYATLPEAELANARFTKFAGYMARYNKSAAREAVAAYTRLAAEHGLSPTQLALAFVASRWFVSSTIVGATSVAQLRDNLDAFDVRLSPQVLTAVAELHRRFRDPATG